MIDGSADAVQSNLSWSVVIKSRVLFCTQRRDRPFPRCTPNRSCAGAILCVPDAQSERLVLSNTRPVQILKDETPLDAGMTGVGQLPLCQHGLHAPPTL